MPTPLTASVDELSIHPSTSFHVALHDVTPRFASQIETIAAALHPLIGTQMAAAIVPHWHGEPLGNFSPGFLSMLQGTFDDLLLHGCRHRRERGAGMVSWISGRADEFNGLNWEETAERLSLGQAALRQLIGRPATGFISPTFARGRLTPELLAQAGLSYNIGFRRIEFANRRPLPIVTWCWDMGRSQLIARGGDLHACTRLRLFPGCLPCLALHPVDVDRGWLPRILELLESWLTAGRRPVLFDRTARTTEVVPGLAADG